MRVARACLLGLVVVAGLAAGCSGGGQANRPVPTTPGPAAVALTGTTAGADARGYVGMARCQTCHADVATRWGHTLHAKALRAASRGTIHASFEGPGASVGEGPAGFRVFERDGRFFMHCLGPDGAMGDYSIDWAIGDRRSHMLVHRRPDGRLQVLPGFVDIQGGYWFPYWEFFFDVGSKGPIWPEDYRFWANPGRGFNAAVYSELCITCHTTGPERRYDPASNTYDTRWVDAGVACETCHGPGAAHVERREYLARGLVTPEQAAGWVPLTMLTGERVMEACAQCHASKQQLRPGYRPGDDWTEFYMPVLLDDATHVHPDGKFRELNYDWLAIHQSRCFTKGGAVCTTCHDAHGSGRPGDLRDADPDAACLRCHAALAEPAAARAHAHHDPAGAGGKCVACHMPKITIENGHGRIHDHTMSVPRPRNARVHGIPDACSTCHAGRKPEWAETVMRDWWPGAQPRPEERLADVIAGGRAGDPAARAGLVGYLSDGSAHWIHRASAARLLGAPAYRDAAVRDALLAALGRTGEHPVVRPSALYGLLGHADDSAVVEVLRAALDDRQLAVRQYAAFGLTLRGDAARADDCRKIIAGIVEFLPDNVDHRAALARVCAIAGDAETAWEHWVICLRIFPMSRAMVSGATELSVAQSAASEAAGDSGAAGRWRARAVDAAAAYVARRPADSWGRVMRAHALAAAGRLDDALVDVAAALRGELPPDQRPVVEAMRADLERRLEQQGR